METMQKIKVCDDYLSWGEDLFLMQDSKPDIEDARVLQERFRCDGYLYFKNFHDRDKILKAKKEIIQVLSDMNALGLNSDDVNSFPNYWGDYHFSPHGEELAMFDEANQSKSILFTKYAVKKMKRLLNLLNGSNLIELFNRIFESPSTTLDKKWLRAVQPTECTGIHADHLYMGRGSKRLTTVWTPFDDIPIELGSLVVGQRSHFMKGDVEIYRHKDTILDNVHGWFSQKPKELFDSNNCKWVTENFQAGDIVIFGLYTLHASTVNMTNRFRLSCDTRFQPLNENIDERYK